MAHFIAPRIQENSEGWGPSSEPEKYKDMPYQPFSKADRLGKVSDWTGQTYQDRKYQNKYNSTFAGPGASQYAYYHEEDDTTFQLVDTSRVQKPVYQRGRMKFNQTKLRKERERRQQQQASMQVLSKTQKSREMDRQRQLRKWQKQFGRQQYDNQRNKPPPKARDASVVVKDTWVLVEDMDFTRLGKLSLPTVEGPEDLYDCGAVEYYDKQYDRVTVKNQMPLKRINRIFHSVTTTDDPVIRKFCKEKDSPNVYATDSILATLMCCTRSNYSWDVIVQRIGDKIFFDKRDNNEFDLLTVSETAVEPPQDEGASINSPRNLALEATFINHNFSQQVLRQGEDKHSFQHPNPFTGRDEEKAGPEVASKAFRYRKWRLGNDIELVCRCEVDAANTGPGGDVQLLSVKSLNEWDSKSCGGVDWRSKLDTQRGAVLATELKNNSCKLAKWTVSAVLAGADQLKFGYVSRTHVKDTDKHAILGTQQFKPSEFASQIALNMDNAWGILRCLIDICMKLKDGKYLIFKDPSKPTVLIYDIPNDSFDSSEEESSDEEGEEGEGEA